MFEDYSFDRRDFLTGAIGLAAVGAAGAAGLGPIGLGGVFTPEKAYGAEIEPIMGTATPGREFKAVDDYVPPAPVVLEDEDPRAKPNEEFIKLNFKEPSGLLKDKVALITGASSGFGREIARAFAREGAKVVGVARREDRLKALSAESGNYDGEIAGFVADMSDRDQVQQAVEFAKKTYGPVDILVNNAGTIGGYQTVKSIQEGAWDYILQLNLTTPILAMKAVIQDMIDNGGGAIINMSSVGGTQGYFGIEYHCTKAALNAATKETAFMFSGQNIRCNAILPGGFNTEIGMSMQNIDEEALAKANDFGAKYVTQGEPEEIAAMALFLASDAAKNINGALISSDGGWTC